MTTTPFEAKLQATIESRNRDVSHRGLATDARSDIGAAAELPEDPPPVARGPQLRSGPMPVPQPATPLPATHRFDEASPPGRVVPLDTRRKRAPLADTFRRDAAARIVISLGPATVVGGLVWGLLQPYRVTLFAPQGQSFWWLAVEPPLLVVLVGIVFHLVVARGLVRDLLDSER